MTILLTQHKRAKAFFTAAILLIVVVSVGIGTVRGNGTSAAASPKTVQGGVSTHVAAHGTVDLRNAPKLSANSSQQPIVVPIDRALPAAQRAKATGMTRGVPQGGQAAPAPSKLKPNFVGGGVAPQLFATHEGIDYNQSGGWFPPDQAIAVGGGCCVSDEWLVEGVNNALAIYNINYSLLAGPYATSTLFQSVMLNGDFFSDPQVTYDATRVHWVIAYLELTSCGNNCISHGYIDIAVSKSVSPIGVPTNYNLYRFDVNLNNDGEYCDYPTLGMEYWDIYVTCATFGTNANANPGSFLGNRTFIFNKTDLYAGSSSPHWGWFFSVNNDLNCGTGAGTCPLFRLAPAMEDGVPSAEWLVGTDAGYLNGATSTNVTLVAITNPNALATNHLPTLTYIHGNLLGSYGDPPGAQQPGTTALVDTGAGIKQFMYKGGRLSFAFATAVNWNGDTATRSGVYWADIEPFLTTVVAHNPQWIAGFNNHQQGYFGYVGAYTYMPTMSPSDEGDDALVFNYSSASIYPSIVYTGRMADDALGTMGQGNSYFVASGSHPNGSGRWGDYSACALNVQPTTRGYLFRGGEYGGSQASATGVGWNTYLYTLRME